MHTCVQCGRYFVQLSRFRKVHCIELGLHSFRPHDWKQRMREMATHTEHTATTTRTQKLLGARGFHTRVNVIDTSESGTLLCPIESVAPKAHTKKHGNDEKHCQERHPRTTNCGCAVAIRPGDDYNHHMSKLFRSSAESRHQLHRTRQPTHRSSLTNKYATTAVLHSTNIPSPPAEFKEVHNPTQTVTTAWESDSKHPVQENGPMTAA